MNKYLKISIILLIFVLVTILVEIIVTQNTPTSQSSAFEVRVVPSDRFNFKTDRYYSVMGDMELFYKVKTVLSTINATLLVLLLATYIDMYRKLKSEFTLGLMLFSVILLFYAILSNPLLQMLFGYQAFGLGPFAMLPDLFTAFALAVLLYLTMK